MIASNDEAPTEIDDLRLGPSVHLGDIPAAHHARIAQLIHQLEPVLTGNHWWLDVTPARDGGLDIRAEVMWTLPDIDGRGGPEIPPGSDDAAIVAATAPYLAAYQAWKDCPDAAEWDRACTHAQQKADALCHEAAADIKGNE